MDCSALRRVERRQEQRATERQPNRQGRARREHGKHEVSVDLHASISRTFCMRSRVENGLVM